MKHIDPTTTSSNSSTTLPPDVTELPARERWTRAFQALRTVMTDPEQTDQVLVFSTYANAGSMKKRIHRFLDDPRGRRLFEEHRTIDARSIDLEALAKLPEGTLGRAYSNFLTSRGLSPDVFENPPDDIHDPTMAYVIMRLRQTHDLWHVVTGYDTDPASEVALQAFTFGQLRAPSSGILALLGTLRGSQLKPTLALDVVKGYRLGRRAEPLAIFPWEDHWSTPLSTVRTMLGLPTDPVDAERLGLEVRAVLAAMANEAASTPTRAPAENGWMKQAGALATTPSTPSTPSTPTPPSSQTPNTSTPNTASASALEISEASTDAFKLDTSKLDRSRDARRAVRRAFRAARRVA